VRWAGELGFTSFSKHRDTFVPAWNDFAFS
jgi:hypothetical protein